MDALEQLVLSGTEKDVQAAERIFRKIVHPGLDSLRLVDRNGLPIQSPACSLRQRSFVLSPRGVPTKVTSHMYSGRSSHIARYSDGFSRVGTPEYYGEDSLVMPSNFGTVKSAPQYGMPQRSTPSRAFPSKASRNGFVPKSATMEREINSSLEDKRFSQSAGSRTSRWTMSSQNMRLEKELSDVANSRTLKRNAEILSHRVDRMYFMSGNSMRLKPRYQVDDDELKQLRELAKSRQSSTRQHRGSRFSSRGVHKVPSVNEKKREDADAVPSERSVNGDIGEMTEKNDPQGKRPSKPHPSNDMRGSGRESPLEGWESPVKGEEPTEHADLIRRMSLHESAVGENKEQTNNGQNDNLKKSETVDTDRTGNDENENVDSKEVLDSNEDATIKEDKEDIKEKEDTNIEEDTEVKVVNGTIKGRADGRKNKEETERIEDKVVSEVSEEQRDSEVTDQIDDDVKEDV